MISNIYQYLTIQTYIYIRNDASRNYFLFSFLSPKTINGLCLRFIKRIVYLSSLVLGKAICSAEGLCVNTDALTRLADKSHLDVRSCLNTLQFVARRAALGGVMNASAALLTAVAEGIKDDRKDLFEGATD